MKYKSNPCVIDAVQWNKPGDHPEIYQCFDGYCGHEYRLNEQLIHTGDYILTHSDGRLEVMPEAEFLSKYEPYVIKGGALIPGQCSNCNGGGKVYRHFRKGTWLSSSACSTCHGTGKVEE